jgi:small GTP-binding protein
MYRPGPPPSRRVKLKLLVLGSAGAGKTSILRRYFYKTFEGVRVPTRGSDFYVGKLQEPLRHARNGEEDGSATIPPAMMDVSISLQMWDTPGRERYYLKQPQRQYTESLSDSFFDQANAVLLVYDMTSSTSFTQLLKWYADLLEITKKNHFPILVVGNKLDVFKATQQRTSTLVHPRRVRQRDVMGLAGSFRGNDFQYEYRVSPLRAANRSPSVGKRRRKTSQEISSFLANRENWTKDNSYLDSLLNSEDGSHPDREMVLLWCMRNGLTHLEVSAATGEGINDAVGTLARMALENKVENEEREAAAAGSQVLDVHRPKKLDLQERYKPKEEKWWSQWIKKC